MKTSFKGGGNGVNDEGKEINNQGNCSKILEGKEETVSKTRIASGVIKRYNIPKTPYQRVFRR